MSPVITLLLCMSIVMGAISSSSSHTSTYIIHIDYTSSSSSSNPHQFYQSLLNTIKTPSSSSSSSSLSLSSSEPELLYTYETTMSGFAAKLTKEQYEAIKAHHAVRYVARDEIVRTHTTYSSHFVGLEVGAGLWSAANLGADVIVGVLDTGIWPEHPSFHDSGFGPVPSKWKGKCEKGTRFGPKNCNRKVVGGRAFFKGYEAMNGKINETEQFKSARDSNGHGTHTASTAAGNLVPGANLFGMAKGVAAGMRFTSRVAAYKVCWEGGCASSDILAAIDNAVADGVDVISLSLGGLPRPYHRDNLAIAAFGAVAKGVFVSCSAGNSGPNPSTVGNVAPWLMTVAASYLDRTFPTRVRLGNGKSFTGSSLYSGKKTKQLPLAYKKTAGGRGAELCTNGTLTPALVKGKMVICERGINSRAAKGMMVKVAGGAGMILLNSPTQGEELFADPHVLPATTLGASAAKALRGFLMQSRNLTASLTFKGTRFGSRAPVVAAFSSRGPSAVDPYVIKPDITAPGVNILAAWPPITAPTELKTDPRRVQFNIVSGTSMSCPHLSGIAALVKSAHLDWSPAAIKSAIMTTAYTHDNRGKLIADAFSSDAKSKYATPFAFGSGHVDPEAAADPGLVYDIIADDYLHYLCGLNYTNSQVSLLARRNYTCPKSKNHHQPDHLNYPSFSIIFSPTNSPKNTNFTFKRTVTNVGDPKSTYKVIIDEPHGVSITIEPQVLSFHKLGQKLSYMVSFFDSNGAKGTSRRGDSSFGSLIWLSRKYIVRSPVAVVWQ